MKNTFRSIVFVRTTTCAALFAIATLVGCGPSPESDTDVTDGDESTEAASADTDTAVNAAGTAFSLTPENTKIQFVGNHTGDDPKPRTCTFAKFDGSLGIVEDQLQSISIKIDTNSIETEFEKLTTHLKAADFFDVKRFTSAAFQSTSIEAAGDGQYKVTGDLTLLGETKPVSFTAQFSAEEPTLNAEFEIDRTQWGMDYDPSKIEKMVEMTVSVGS